MISDIAKCPPGARREDRISFIKKYWIKIIKGQISTKLEVTKGRELEMKAKRTKGSSSYLPWGNKSRALRWGPHTAPHTWHNRGVSWHSIKKPPEAPLAKVRMCFLMMAQPLRKLEIFWVLYNTFLRDTDFLIYLGEVNGFINLNILFYGKFTWYKKIRLFISNQEKISQHQNEHLLNMKLMFTWLSLRVPAPWGTRPEDSPLALGFLCHEAQLGPEGL